MEFTRIIKMRGIGQAAPRFIPQKEAAKIPGNKPNVYLRGTGLKKGKFGEEVIEDRRSVSPGRSSPARGTFKY
jgi:hypothetical protein